MITITSVLAKPRFGLAILAIFIVALSCSRKPIEKAVKAPSENYIFIEIFETNDGKVLEGIAPPGPRIDGPTYSYSPESGEVLSFRDNYFDKDSLNYLIGQSVVLRGAQGGGMHSRLTPIKNTPYSFINLTIDSITDQEIIATWNKEQFKLAAGEDFIKAQTHIDTLIMHNERCIIEKTITHTIRFHGVLKKENLIIN